MDDDQEEWVRSAECRVDGGGNKAELESEWRGKKEGELSRKRGVGGTQGEGGEQDEHRGEEESVEGDRESEERG